jgi:hypothetical protein
MGRRLAAAATAPVEVWESPDAGHDDIGEQQRELREFFQHHQGARPIGGCNHAKAKVPQQAFGIATHKLVVFHQEDGFNRRL